MLHRILLVLPPEKKKKFIKKGLNVWFSKIIPTVMNNLWNNTTIEILEILTDVIVDYDYTESSQWYSVLECICIATK